MNVKLFSAAFITALITLTVTACEPVGAIPPPDIPWKDQIEKGGKILNGFRFKVEDGGIRIIRYEGEGETDYAKIDEAGGINLTIPEEIEGVPVRTIGIHAFREKNLTGVVIPGSVILIEYYAFGNNRLSNIVIPDSVTSIGIAAFKINELTGVLISNRVISIERDTFRNNKLTEIIIPLSVSSIDGSAFSNNQLTRVLLPDRVTYVGLNAFGDNPELAEITLGKNVDFREWLTYSSGFIKTYYSGGSQAGTYIKPDINKDVWIKKE